MKSLKKYVASSIMKICGWQFEGELGDIKKEVIVVAPHTSNWDYLFMIGSSWYHKVKINWVGKKELFMAFWPLKKLYEITGGIPVDRSKSNNLVEKLSSMIRGMNEIHLCIPPEGTRGKGQGWRSGFYYTALQANVPVRLSYLDYKAKKAGLGEVYYLTGDVDKDIEYIRNYYKPYEGKYPEKQSPIEFKKKQQ